MYYFDMPLTNMAERFRGLDTFNFVTLNEILKELFMQVKVVKIVGNWDSHPGQNIVPVFV